MFGIGNLKGIKDMLAKILKKVLKERYSKTIYGFSVISGISIFSIGLSAVSGYLTKREYLYRWLTDDVGVALGTGIALVLVGAALYFVSLRIDEHDDRLKNLEKK